MFEDGVAKPAVEVVGRNGQAVIITFFEPPQDADEEELPDGAWDELMKAIEECQMDTGIPDLAQQHDHYLYGTPRRY